MAGTIKTKLAKIIESYFGNGSVCNPEKLKVNRGATQFNDWCSWTGSVTLPNGNNVSICSYDTMRYLVNVGAVVEIGNDVFIKELAGKNQQEEPYNVKLPITVEIYTDVKKS